MSSVSFVVPGRVAGKGRPRVTVRGKFAHAYTPAKTRNAEAMVRHFGAEAMKGRPPFEGPLALDILVSLNTPPSWSKKKRAAARYVVSRPDGTNIAKTCEDALNFICFRDDSQISDLRIRRYYDDSKPEQVEIKICQLGESKEAEGEIIPWEPRKALAK